MTRPTTTSPPPPLPQSTSMRRRRRRILLLHGVRAAAFLMVLAGLGNLLRTTAVGGAPAAVVRDWVLLGGGFAVILTAEIVRRHAHPEPGRSPWHPRPEKIRASNVTNRGRHTTYR